MNFFKYVFGIMSVLLVSTEIALAGGGAVMGQFYSAPDGVRVIHGYNSQQLGNLYRVSTNLYVQTKDDAYLADIKLLILKLRMSPTGREILRQVATYTPVNAPEDSVGPLIEHIEGVDVTKAKVVTVIREPESSGRLFETVPSTFVDRNKAKSVLKSNLQINNPVICVKRMSIFCFRYLI